MFRREWRHQVLVLTLLAVAVAAAIASITVVYNTSPDDNADFGSANHLLRFDGADPRQLEAGLAAAEKWFGKTDVIEHRSVAVPGSVDAIDFRAQDPNGPYGGELLDLRRGSYPTGAGQVAVTDRVADILALELGSTLSLDGTRRRVVGIVENPRRLSDEFALVAPGSAGAPDHVTVLLDARAGSVRSFMDLRSDGRRRPALLGSESPGNARTADTLAMFSVATVFLLLAALIAAAGFAVVAQRRLRQLGMLSAIGATGRHLRLVLVTNGALVGMLAAIGGTIAGLALWLAVAPTLESAADHRIDRLSLPWGLIAMAFVLGVLAATAAAWWPARAVSRLPVMLALSGRPPRPRPARHAAIAATALIAVGVALLALSGRDRPLLIVAGILATILGCLLVGPPAIRIFSGLAGRASVAPRVALRDLARYQARSGAALAAVTLALGIAAAIVVVASAEDAKSASEPPNLSDRQIRVHLGGEKTREVIPLQALGELDRLAAGTRELAAGLDDAAVIPLRKAFDPDEPAFFDTVAGYRVRPTIELTRSEDGRLFRVEADLYVATPAVLSYIGMDSAAIRPGTEFLVDRGVRTPGLGFPTLADGRREELRLGNVQLIETGRRLLGAGMAPHADRVAFVTPDGLRRHGWKQVPAGWLVESSRALTSDQIADARELAANAGLAIEVRREATSSARAMAIAIAAGALLALGILAMTVGLIRSESTGDLRVLTATGATTRIRRTLTATTAGALALLGALLGVAGAYIVLAALFHDDLGYLGHVPALYLALAVAGVPLIATAAAWLLAGREPPAVARPVIE
jgi:putative ABC transport system permease protein